MSAPRSPAVSLAEPDPLSPRVAALAAALTEGVLRSGATSVDLLALPFRPSPTRTSRVLRLELTREDGSVGHVVTRAVEDSAITAFATREPDAAVEALYRDSLDPRPDLASNDALRALRSARDRVGTARVRALTDLLEDGEGDDEVLFLLAVDDETATAEGVAVVTALLTDVLDGAPVEWAARRGARPRTGAPA